MAIVATDPVDWENANVILIYSDAGFNLRARAEIEGWTVGKEFVPTCESQLTQVLKNGKPAFRGFCYRLTEEVKEGNRLACEAANKALDKMPVTEHTCRSEDTTISNPQLRKYLDSEVQRVFKMLYGIWVRDEIISRAVDKLENEVVTRVLAEPPTRR